MSQYVIALCTVADQQAAQTIAHSVVQAKLAACVNIIGPLQSVYAWQGQVCQEREYQLVLKTHSAKIDELFNQVLRLHPYDVPEWLVLDVQQGSEDYLNWINSSLT